jgi:hypothetical protein
MSKAMGALQANNQVIQREMIKEPVIWITEWREPPASHG